MNLPRRPDSGSLNKVPDSGTFRLPPLPPRHAALQQVVSRMYVAQDPSEILQLLLSAAREYTGVSAMSVLRETPGGGLSGEPADLVPEGPVLDYVYREGRPITVPQGNRWITVVPLRAPDVPLGVLSIDVTPKAEEIARLDLEPLAILADQASILIRNAELVRRSVGESVLLANILDSITNALVTIDLTGRITRLNRNATAILELNPDGLNRPYEEVFPREVSGAVKELLKEASLQGFSMERMVTVKQANGLELPIAVSISPLRDEAFAPLGTIVVIRDMTASRELERLRKLDQMKSEFVANVSHELKTPLTSIKAYTEALLDMAQEEQVKSFLKVIDEESDRLLSLINDLLNVSRIQAGRMKLHVSPTRPRTVVDEVLGVSRVQSDKHEVVVEAADGLPDMLLDKDKMKEVMINLLSNAIKYSPQGGAIHVRLAVEDNNLRIEIADPGIGIPKEHHGRLFQAFARVDSSATAEIPGTGLGLVIVKAIVELHGGRIWFESEPGHGTTFFLLIPIRREIDRTEMGQHLGSMT